MYDLAWKEIQYDVNYIKGGKTHPLKVTLRVIPPSDLIQYDKSLARPYRQEQDGGTTMNLSPSAKELELFDQYFVSITKANPEDSREKLLEKIPQAVKRATIRDGVGGVWPEEKEEAKEVSLDEILEVDTGIKILAAANGVVHAITHSLADPEAEDELAYRRATVGALKSLPGRRRQEFIVVEDFGIYTKLYDKLIQSADGYCIDHENGPIPAEKLKELVPYYHKKAVIRELFGTAEVRQEQDDNFF